MSTRCYDTDLNDAAWAWKFCSDTVAISFFRGHDFCELDWNAGFDHLPIIGSDRFGNFIGMNVEVGFAADLVAPVPVPTVLCKECLARGKIVVGAIWSGCSNFRPVTPNDLASLAKLTGPKIDAIRTPVLRYLLNADHVIAAVNPYQMNKITFEPDGSLEFNRGKKETLARPTWSLPINVGALKLSMGLSSQRAARIDAKDGSLAQIFWRSFRA
jgi:hypothetical protein